MDNGINIKMPRRRATKKEIRATADAIVEVFEAAHNYRMDQKTVRDALSLLVTPSRPIGGNITIASNSFHDASEVENDFGPTSFGQTPEDESRS